MSEEYSLEFIELAAKRECKQVADDIVDLLHLPGHTPRDTGALQDGYHAVGTQEGAEVRSRVDYWKYVEYGHRIVDRDGEVVGYQEPQSHVRAAVEEVRTRKGRA